MRAHADARAAEGTEDLDGRAFTVGHDVFLVSSASNRIQRQPDDSSKAKAADPPLPSADELTSRIATSIGIWETNRGKDAPAPKESRLKTVAGVAASMATIEQATMPYTIGAIKKHKALRDKASKPLTAKELNDAEARASAVVSLLSAVATASVAKTTADDFIKNQRAAINKTGLSDADVRTMFRGVELKAKIDKANTAVTSTKGAKQKSAKLTEEIAAISDADRLGLDAASLKSYINKPRNWGENRAAWQRKAVDAMPDDVGARIEKVAVSDQGTALATPVIRARVDKALAKDAKATLQDIVTTVAQQNNPGEKNYGTNVWKNYQRLYVK